MSTWKQGDLEKQEQLEGELDFERRSHRSGLICHCCWKSKVKWRKGSHYECIAWCGREDGSLISLGFHDFAMMNCVVLEIWNFMINCVYICDSMIEIMFGSLWICMYKILPLMKVWVLELCTWLLMKLLWIMMNINVIICDGCDDMIHC